MNYLFKLFLCNFLFFAFSSVFAKSNTIKINNYVEYCQTSNTNTIEFTKKINLKNPESLAPFQVIFLKNHKQLLLEKIENNFDINSCGAPIDSSILGLASYLGILEDVELIVKNGANLEYPKTPNGESPIITSISNNRYTVSNFLMKSGANAKTTYGKSYNYSALDALASSYKDNYYDEQKELELAEFLVKSGISPNRKDENPCIGKTPLLRAVASNKPSLVIFFIKNGGDPYIKGKNGKDSFDIAKSLNREEIIKILQEGGYGK